MPPMTRQATSGLLIPEDMYNATVVSVEVAPPYTPRDGKPLPAEEKPRKPQFLITYKLSAPEDPEVDGYHLTEYATITFNPTLAGKPSKWSQRCSVFCQLAGVPFPDEPGAEYDTDDFANLKVRVNVINEKRDDGSLKNVVASVTAIKRRTSATRHEPEAIAESTETQELPF